MKIEAVGKNVIFTFNENIRDGKIQDSTKSGIILNADYGNQDRPRWGKVIAKGPEVTDEINIDEYVLVQNLQWTHGFEIDSTMYWKTDESKIFATSSELITTY